MKSAFATCIVMLLAAAGASLDGECVDRVKNDHGKTCSANRYLSKYEGREPEEYDVDGWVAYCLEPFASFELTCNSGGWWPTTIDGKMWGTRCLLFHPGKQSEVHSANCKYKHAESDWRWQMRQARRR